MVYITFYMACLMHASLKVCASQQERPTCLRVGARCCGWVQLVVQWLWHPRCLRALHALRKSCSGYGIRNVFLLYMLFESAFLSNLVGNCVLHAPGAPAEVFFIGVVFAVCFCSGSVARVTAGSPLRHKPQEVHFMVFITFCMACLMHAQTNPC